MAIRLPLVAQVPLVVLAVASGSQRAADALDYVVCFGSSCVVKDPLLFHDVSFLQVGLELGDASEGSFEHVGNASSVRVHGREHTNVTATTVQKALDTVTDIARVRAAGRLSPDALFLLQVRNSIPIGAIIVIVVIIIVVVAITFAISTRRPTEDLLSDGQKSGLVPREVTPTSTSRGRSAGSVRNMPQQGTAGSTWSSSGAAGSAVMNIAQGEHQQAGASLEVPPICARLILQTTEARFLIGMDRLTLKKGTININGTSGRTLLNASLDHLGGRRRLQLASIGQGEPPRTTVLSPYLAGGAFELSGEKGAPYGTIELQDNGVYTLRYQEQPVMIVELEHLEDWKMTAKSMDGRKLGWSERQGGRDQDNWKLRVIPGADAVLITTCMLAMILLPDRA